MPALPSLLAGAHTGDALAQLALYYHRQALQDARPSVSRQACAWLRDLLLSAPDQQTAREQLQARLAAGWPEAEASFWRPVCQQAFALLQQVMDAGGSLHPLVVGVTDGFRHLCLRCGQDADKRESLRFFRERDRRWLLAPEIGPAPRSVYERCQSCLQPLCPGEAVVFVPGGTVRHPAGCACQECNQRGLAFVLHLYACARQTQQIVLPHLAQVVAPSQQQGVERAVALCWRQGWYMLSEDPRAHALSARALAPSQEENALRTVAPLA